MSAYTKGKISKESKGCRDGKEGKACREFKKQTRRSRKQASEWQTIRMME
jgi:hypothetical protein